MKIMGLGFQERNQTGFTHKINILFSDLTAAAVTQTLNIYPKSGTSIQALGGIEKTAIQLVTPFTGGTIATMVGDLGDAQTVGRYIANASTDLFTALATNTKPHVVNATSYIYSPANVTNTQNVLQFKFTSTVGNVNAATAGELNVYIRFTDFADLSARPLANP